MCCCSYEEDDVSDGDSYVNETASDSHGDDRSTVNATMVMPMIAETVPVAMFLVRFAATVGFVDHCREGDCFHDDEDLQVRSRRLP